jgi:hypothetical protein
MEKKSGELHKTLDTLRGSSKYYILHAPPEFPSPHENEHFQPGGTSRAKTPNLLDDDDLTN